MLTRRNALLGAAATGAVAPITQSCSSGSSHEEVARGLRRPITVDNSDRASLLCELVRYATLAPSSHNTQCWKFRMQERSITTEPDLSRRCPVVDTDDHHLFVSLSCATENLAHALGIRNAFLNRPVEVESIRPQFASALGLENQRRDLVVRFGRGPAMSLSMRRPVQAVLV